MDRILDLTREVSSPEKEEALVALQTGVSSSVSQVIGLAYSSLIDESWKRAEDWELYGGIQAKVWYQTLPIGASLTEASLLNVRVDLLNIMRPAGEVIALLKRANMELEGLQEFYGECEMCADNEYQLVSSMYVIPMYRSQCANIACLGIFYS